MNDWLKNKFIGERWFFILLLFGAQNLFGQKELVEELKRLTEVGLYDKVISEYAARSKDYPAGALYYIGLSYYMKADDEHCIQFMDQCIVKDPKYAEAFFIKASTLSEMKEYATAEHNFQQAIMLNPYRTDYYCGLGDVYYQQAKDSMALVAFQKASQQRVSAGRAFFMIAQIYAEQKKNELALEAFYTAKIKNAKNDSYATILFNIGVLEMLNGNNAKAEVALLELIEIAPEDYHACAKLIQLYHAQREYTKAQPFIQRLYEANRTNRLKDHLADKFCFDRFDWRGMSIQAYERFESGASDKAYIKHLFYVINDKEEIEFTLQTEYSPLAADQGLPPFQLCMQKEGIHTIFMLAFNAPVNYEELNENVIKALEGKIKTKGN